MARGDMDSFPDTLPAGLEATESRRKEGASETPERPLGAAETAAKGKERLGASQSKAARQSASIERSVGSLPRTGGSEAYGRRVEQILGDWSEREQDFAAEAEAALDSLAQDTLAFTAADDETRPHGLEGDSSFSAPESLEVARNEGIEVTIETMRRMGPRVDALEDWASRPRGIGEIDIHGARRDEIIDAVFRFQDLYIAVDEWMHENEEGAQPPPEILDDARKAKDVLNEIRDFEAELASLDRLAEQYELLRTYTHAEIERRFSEGKPNPIMEYAVEHILLKQQEAGISTSIERVRASLVHETVRESFKPVDRLAHGKRSPELADAAARLSNQILSKKSSAARASIEALRVAGGPEAGLDLEKLGADLEKAEKERSERFEKLKGARSEMIEARLSDPELTEEARERLEERARKERIMHHPDTKVTNARPFLSSRFAGKALRPFRATLVLEGEEPLEVVIKADNADRFIRMGITPGDESTRESLATLHQMALGLEAHTIATAARESLVVDGEDIGSVTITEHMPGDPLSDSGPIEALDDPDAMEAYQLLAISHRLLGRTDGAPRNMPDRTVEYDFGAAMPGTQEIKKHHRQWAFSSFPAFAVSGMPFSKAAMRLANGLEGNARLSSWEDAVKETYPEGSESAEAYLQRHRAVQAELAGLDRHPLYGKKGHYEDFGIDVVEELRQRESDRHAEFLQQNVSELHQRGGQDDQSN